jgi:uncharacterized membrane protein
MRPMIRFMLGFVCVVLLGLAFAPSADAAVLFPRLALSRQAVVVQRQAIVARQPVVLRQRVVAPLVVPHVQQFVVPQTIVVPRVQQFRVQSFSAPGCGAFLVK